MKITLKSRKAIAGYMFTLPFTLGFLLLFLFPLSQSILYSFSKIKITPTGFTIIPNGVQNYYNLFFVDTNFRIVLTNSIKKMLINVPVILIFSFYASTLLNNKFKGRTAARAIFFLPVVLASGVIISIENRDMMMKALNRAIQGQANNSSDAFSISIQLRSMLSNSGIGGGYVNYIFQALDTIYPIVISSGMQIIILLSGLQSIPNSLYEASNIEGATSWENFWKITLPMVSPLILVCAVYSIIDSFTRGDNEVMRVINEAAFKAADFGTSAAMSVVYSLVVIVFVLLTAGIISRKVFYYDR